MSIARCAVRTGSACVPGLASLPLGDTNTARAGAPLTGNANVALTTVLALTFASVQTTGLPLQVAPDRLASAKPGLGVIVRVTVSPIATTQLVAFWQPAAGFASLSVTVPSGPLLAVTSIVGVTKNDAASVSAFAAVKVHGFCVPDAHEPPVHADHWFPASGVAVTVILSPTSARQLVTSVQDASPVLASVTVTLPLPAALVPIVIVAAKSAVSVSAAAAALKVQGLARP